MRDAQYRNLKERDTHASRGGFLLAAGALEGLGALAEFFDQELEEAQ